MQSPLPDMSLHLAPSLLFSVLLGFGISLSYLLQAVLFAWIIHQALFPVPDAPFLLVIALTGNVLLRAILISVRTAHTGKLAATVRTRLRLRLFTPLLAPGYAVMQAHSPAKLLGLLTEGVEVMEGFYSRYLPALILAVLSGAATILTLASVDWLSALVLLLFMVACPLIDQLFLRHQRQRIVGVFAAMQQFADAFMDALRGILTLKAYNAVPRFRARLANHAALLRSESMSALRITMMRGGITRFIALSGAASLVVLNAWRATQGSVEPIVLLLTLFIAWEAFRPILHLENIFHILWAAQEMRPAMQTLAATPQTISEPNTPHPLPAGHALSFEQVSFCWPGHTRPVFKNLSLTFAENGHTVVTGPSGSGKSTLMQLITRFIVPDSGTIRLGNVPIDQLSLTALRSRISWVSQQVFLLDGSLAENLRLSRPDASDAELWQALSRAQLADWVRSLPRQLNTPAGENGGLLSGGQRQRLAIARALLKQSPILIFDEATASLDIANESALQESIAALKGTCTLVSIAHRLSVIGQADYVIVLQDGALREQGTPAQLRRAGGYIAGLYSAKENAS